MDLENEEVYQSQGRNDKFSKHHRVMKSGRTTKTPNKLMTTSSDEAPARRRPSKISVSVKKELARLQSIAIAIKSKQETKKTTCEKIMGQDNVSKVACNNLGVASVDNSTFSLPMNASETTGRPWTGLTQAIKSNHGTRKTTCKKIMVQDNVSKVACDNLDVTPVDNSTFLLPINASEMAGHTEMEMVIPLVHNFNLNAVAITLSNESCTGKTFGNKSNNLIVTPIENSTFSMPVNASDMAGQTEMEVVIPPVRNFESNAEAVTLPNESHTEKTISNKSTAANLTATSVTYVPTKTSLTSKCGNATSTLKKSHFDSEKKTNYPRTTPERTTDDLPRILETLQYEQNINKLSHGYVC